MVTVTIGHSIQEENELRNKRLAICKRCPLFTNHSDLGYICDNNKHLLLNGVVVSNPTSNSRSGCGCKLEIKTRLKNEECTLGKW